jgi:PHD/YefM family antitoxin component YafN of YafNO toxin-antitoxin module
MKRMCATKAYKNFFKLLDAMPAVGTLEITRSGDKDGCYVLSKEEYDGMMETMAIMKNSELYDKIMRARADTEVTRYKSVDDLLEKFGKKNGTKV